MMPDALRQRLDRWRLRDLLDKYTGLRVHPSDGEVVEIAGTLRFCARGPGLEPLVDAYAVSLHAPLGFPDGILSVWETGGRIPKTHHKLADGSLCLAAPTALRIALSLSPSLLTFVDQFVIPYLYSYSYFEKHGSMPFGELDHGAKGIRQYLAELFGMEREVGAEQMLYLASRRKRVANKLPCPCGSGLRLGRCHHRRVNGLRDRLGRTWFQKEYAALDLPNRISK